jgi:hypothetical protein
MIIKKHDSGGVEQFLKYSKGRNPFVCSYIWKGPILIIMIKLSFLADVVVEFWPPVSFKRSEPVEI